MAHFKISLGCSAIAVRNSPSKSAFCSGSRPSSIGLLLRETIRYGRSVSDERGYYHEDSPSNHSGKHNNTNTGNRSIIRRIANIFTGVNRLRYPKRIKQSQG